MYSEAQLELGQLAGQFNFPGAVQGIHQRIEAIQFLRAARTIEYRSGSPVVLRMCNPDSYRPTALYATARIERSRRLCGSSITANSARSIISS